MSLGEREGGRVRTASSLVFERGRQRQLAGLLGGHHRMCREGLGAPGSERDFFIDNLLVRIHFIVEMIRWTGLAPWELEFSFPGSHTAPFLVPGSP